MVTRVKICGLTRAEDAEAALTHGADALGFVYEPTSPRFVGDDSLLARQFGPFVVTVAVFGKLRDLDTGCMYRQFVTATIWNTRVQIIPVLRPIKDAKMGDLVKLIEKLSPTLGGLAVIDAFHPEAYGGTGEKVDWDQAAEIVQSTDRRIILAGGLTPDNVGEAVAKVKPYAVDVSSGVESAPGIKDHIKIRDFVQATRAIRRP